MARKQTRRAAAKKKIRSLHSRQIKALRKHKKAKLKKVRTAHKAMKREVTKLQKRLKKLKRPAGYKGARGGRLSLGNVKGVKRFGKAMKAARGAGWKDSLKSGLKKMAGSEALRKIGTGLLNTAVHVGTTLVTHHVQKMKNHAEQVAQNLQNAAEEKLRQATEIATRRAFI